MTTAREALTADIDHRRKRGGHSWRHLAREVGGDPLFVTAALMGQHPLPAEMATKLGSVLELSDDQIAELQEIPALRIGETLQIPADPTIYRFYEALGVYGPALRALIHEEFGDGIMSAINFSADVERVPGPDGDRVRVTLEGKFLKYQW